MPVDKLGINRRFNITREMLGTVEHNINVLMRVEAIDQEESQDLLADVRTLARRLDRAHRAYANMLTEADDRQMPDSFGADPTMEY